MNKHLLEEIKKLKSIAEVGLLYSNSEYDKERYTELRNMAFRLLHQASGCSIDALQEAFFLMKDYPTAKVDIRGLIISPDATQVLLVKESLDGKWSLPGGWADIGFSPRETIIKEIKEETGLEVTPEKLLAVFDNRMHAHPPELVYVYKMIFYCKAISTQFNIGFDILDVKYFDISNLPQLSENRILKSQIEFLCHKISSLNYETYFD